jgi:hypothetical protein
MRMEPNRAIDRGAAWRRSPQLLLHHILKLYSAIEPENTRKNLRHPGIFVDLFSCGNGIDGLLSADKFVGHNSEQGLTGESNCGRLKNQAILFYMQNLG